MVSLVIVLNFYAPRLLFSIWKLLQKKL